MRLAIFPGTFNPLHWGHLCIAEAAVVQCELEVVSLVLSPQPPNKPKRPDLLPVQARADIIRNSLDESSFLQLDPRELSRSGPSYTLDTVRDVAAEHGLAEVPMILGLDSFLTLPSWYGSDELGKLCRFLVAGRPGWQMSDIGDTLSTFHDNLRWQLLEAPMLSISSSQIRERKREAKSYRYLLPSRKAYEIYAST